MSPKEFLDAVLTAFFPRRCPYCGTVLTPEERICKDCLAHLPRIEEPRCPYCGASKKDCCCHKRQRYFTCVLAPFYYEDAARKAIERYKFQNKPFLASALAKDMARTVTDHVPLAEVDCITYVPFTKKQKKEREFNPSEALARALAKELSMPCEPLLLKLYETKTQHLLSKEDRKGNVLGVFDVAPHADVQNKSILLVDDIKTTGSTLSECAKMLVLGDAKAVYCATFAIAHYTKKK